MSELDEFKKVVSPIAYGLALKTETGTTEYQQLYAEVDVVKYFENKPQLTIPKKISEMLDEELKDSDDKLYTFNKCYEDMTLPDALLLHKNYAIICAYLAGKALGVDLVKVVKG